MPGKYIFSKLCCLVISEATIISLDAQSAFDQVQWQYIIWTLEEFGFEALFRKWIEVIYMLNQVIPTKTSHTHLRYTMTLDWEALFPHFCLQSWRKLWQLVLDLEDLEITSIVLHGIPQQLSLYADDILLYLSIPKTSIPALLSRINNFISLWDFQLMSKNIEEEFLQTIPFQKVYSSFTHLGITVTKKADDLLWVNWWKEITNYSKI